MAGRDKTDGGDGDDDADDDVGPHCRGGGGCSVLLSSSL